MKREELYLDQLLGRMVVAANNRPLGRLEECRACRAELHVCKMCEWYSLSVAKQCRETVAEEVKDKERANFCDYFKPRAGAHSKTDGSAADRARADLDSLFKK